MKAEVGVPQQSAEMISVAHVNDVRLKSRISLVNIAEAKEFTFIIVDGNNGIDIGRQKRGDELGTDGARGASHDDAATGISLLQQGALRPRPRLGVACSKPISIEVFKVICPSPVTIFFAPQ